MVKRILFVCTGNMDRSPTAEGLLSGRENFEVKSAGTWVHAKNRISKDLIEWADMIFVMEDHHRDAILDLCPEADNKIVVLGVPDVYRRNDPRLIEILKEKIAKHLNVEW